MDFIIKSHLHFTDEETEAWSFCGWSKDRWGVQEVTELGLKVSCLFFLSQGLELGILLSQASLGLQAAPSCPAVSHLLHSSFHRLTTLNYNDSLQNIGRAFAFASECAWYLLGVHMCSPEK